MKESHLHYLYECRKLGKTFHTTEGKELEVLSFGQFNKSSGPDFLEAKVKIENKVWAGHIEFHLKSSDWLKHGHQNDEAYRNVIAHFVLEHDKEIYSGQYQLPVVELKDIILSSNKFLATSQKNWIPCEKFIPELDAEIIKTQMAIALENRLKRKRQIVIDLMKANQNDQRKTLFILIAQILGGKYNAAAMTTLLTMTDFNTIAHMGYEQEKLNSYFLGLSGLQMDDIFEYQKTLYQLKPMNPVAWKKYGMRPPSQPVNRIKQLAVLISQANDFTIYDNLNEWRDYLNIKIDGRMLLSTAYRDLILINAVVPFMLALSRFKGDKQLQANAMRIFRNIRPEQNKIIKGWKNLGVKADSAIESQALIELKNEFCNEKNCLFCGIGRKVLKT